LENCEEILMVARSVLPLVALCAMACADVLGIDDARMDPALNAATSLESGSDAADGPAPTLCEEYCETVIRACSDNESDSFDVYDSPFTCERQCLLLTPGAERDQSGNTVHCRLFHARVAELSRGERLTECPAAGPGGDGVCGANCEGYCTLMLATCSGLFETLDACRASCALVPDVGGYDISQTSGDSLQCRLYHLGAALVSPEHHCPHAAGAYPCAGARGADN
jgi:hypothetical protein